MARTPVTVNTFGVNGNLADPAGNAVDQANGMNVALASGATPPAHCASSRSAPPLRCRTPAAQRAQYDTQTAQIWALLATGFSLSSVTVQLDAVASVGVEPTGYSDPAGV
jgi:hypothetical protein